MLAWKSFTDNHLNMKQKDSKFLLNKSLMGSICWALLGVHLNSCSSFKQSADHF